jgi:hypothetical protein
MSLGKSRALWKETKHVTSETRFVSELPPSGREASRERIVETVMSSLSARRKFASAGNPYRLSDTSVI